MKVPHSPFLKMHVPKHCTMFLTFDLLLYLRTQKLFGNFEFQFFLKKKQNIRQVFLKTMQTYISALNRLILK